MILVTGAGGYIGSVLIPMLLDLGYRVRAVDRYYFGCYLPQHDRLEIVKEDVRRLTDDHFAGVEAVIDGAALSLDPTDSLLTDTTWAVNHHARARTAAMAKKAGAKRYIVTASCSVYGLQPPEVICTEESPPAPLTVYSKSNLLAEQDTLGLADENFCTTAIRQGTVFGMSPRMRFDIAINRMTLHAYTNGVLPLMREGTQWRTWVHVRDTSRAICMLLATDPNVITGQVYNVGSEACTVQLRPLAEMVARIVPRDVEIQMYGDADIRSYRCAFDKIEALGFKAEISVEQGIQEIVDALVAGTVDTSDRTVNITWYQHLEEWARITDDVRLHGGIFRLAE